MVKELDRMKFRRVYLPWDSLRKETAAQLSELDVCQVKTLTEVLDQLFGKRAPREKIQTNEA